MRTLPLQRDSCLHPLKRRLVSRLTPELLGADLVERRGFFCSCPEGLSLPLTSAPVTVRSLQDLSRIYIRRTLRNLASEDAHAKATAQRIPQKRKRRRCRRRRISTYVFVGNQLIPQTIESEEEQHPEEEHKEAEEEEERDIGDIEVVKQVNVLREQITALPLPESLKAYLLYYREK